MEDEFERRRKEREERRKERRKSFREFEASLLTNSSPSPSPSEVTVEPPKPTESKGAEVMEEKKSPEEKKEESKSEKKSEQQTQIQTQPNPTPKKDKYKMRPTKERLLPQVPEPESSRMEVERLFTKGISELPDTDLLRNHLHNEGRLAKSTAMALLERVTEVLKKEPNVLRLEAPTQVVGDIHGQFYDLLNLLSKGGSPKDTKYLFLGDYVDRGFFSTEVFFYLSALKISHPAHVSLLRGNHESRGCTEHYSFLEECLSKYDKEVYDKFMLAFDALPLAAVVKSRECGGFLCLHGGISPAIRDVTSIEEIDRFTEIPEEGELCDVVWADPMRPEEGDFLKSPKLFSFSEN